MSKPGFHPHDHHRCISDAMTAAEAHCAANRLHLTPVRRRTLEILLSEHRALGAYDILARLDAAGFGGQPPVAYRALDFLTMHGFVHKIEALNAYVACAIPGGTIAGHAPAFLICRACGKVEEAEAEPAKGPLARAARAAGFDIERAVIEAQGLCPGCKEVPA
jgi:Fur family zinc uptake transcriptional regulator